MAEATVDDRPPLDATLSDRRRPWRVDYQDAQLTALLRGEPTNTNPAIPNLPPADDLSPARGILIGLPIGGAMWMVVSASWYFM